MTFILVLNILLISDFCQSFKPNFYNGRYFTKEIKPTPSTFRTIIETSSHNPFKETKKYHNSKQTSKNLQKVDSKLRSTTLKPSLHPEHKKYNNTHLETQFLSPTRAYTAGAISNILNRFSTTPVLPNTFGSYQSQIEFESPITHGTLETVTAASLQGETFHSNSRQPNSEKSSRFEKAPAAVVALVRAASLNTEVFHLPQNETATEDHQPLLAPQQLPAFQYEQTVVHNNEPKHLNFPFIRRQRNLSDNLKDFDDKFTEHEQSGGDNNQTQQNAGQQDDAQPNADAAETMVVAETAREHPQDRHEMRYFHDIFLNYPEPHHANYGHVQLSPQLFEKRFESAKEGNRYKGEIFWKDNKGGYAQHHWDMALGKL